MHHLNLSIQILLLTVAVSNSAFARCSPSDNSLSGATAFEGVVDARPYVLVLSSEGGKLTGKLAFSDSEHSFGVMGTLRADSSVDASAVDRAQGRIARLGASFDPSALDCGELVGLWRWQNGTVSPLVASLVWKSGAMLDHLYQNAGVADDELIERSAIEFRRDVLAGLRMRVADRLRYPIHAPYGLTIRNKEDVLAHYAQLFSSDFIWNVRCSVPLLMFSRDQGVMLGDGEVWFDAQGKVETINEPIKRRSDTCARK